jgi:hypothetical protein
MTWASPQDVIDKTGMTVSDPVLKQAQAVVELFADTTEDASDAGNITAKNLRLLKLATAYQAAWITQHPDAFTNVDLTNFNQDQVSGTLAHANALILAPLAKRAIDRLSWKRIRSLQIGPRGGYSSIPRRMNLTSAVADDDDPRWQPLGGGPC